nr:RecName: Full=Endopeptidase L4 [Lysobacter sp. XL1]
AVVNGVNYVGETTAA